MTTKKLHRRVARTVCRNCGGPILRGRKSNHWTHALDDGSVERDCAGVPGWTAEPTPLPDAAPRRAAPVKR